MKKILGYRGLKPCVSIPATKHRLWSCASFPRKNVTPADSKPGREYRLYLGKLVATAKAVWIPARAALGRNDGEEMLSPSRSPGYRNAKLISIFSATSTGSPLRVPGLNFHFLSASTAFSSRPNPKPRSTFRISIEPSLRTMADKTTLP